MCKYVVLIKFTEKGSGGIAESVNRADSFHSTAAAAGCTVEARYWTLGPYDGVLILSAPDEETAAAVVLSLTKAGNVTTCMLRAFEDDEFWKVLRMLP